jgi:hypothetical protein|tara:strand:- start:62 stop:247 length:186 start_codon:yes stop_codon:yes gene_type:complete
MTQFEWLVLAVGILMGGFITSLCYCLPIKRLRKQVYKLRGQVYYWSRQIPVPKKRGRPKKV